MKQITKQIQKQEEYFIQFTDEELKQLDIQEGDKFTCEINEQDNSILMKKFATLEINLAEFSRETLEMLISESIEKDISVNEVINNVLEQTIENLENTSKYLDQIEEVDKSILSSDE